MSVSAYILAPRVLFTINCDEYSSLGAANNTLTIIQTLLQLRGKGASLKQTIEGAAFIFCTLVIIRTQFYSGVCTSKNISRGGQMRKCKLRGFSEQCSMRGSVCVTHTYPAADVTVCKTLRSTEARDNY